MQRAERLDARRRVARALSVEGWHDIDTTLRAFDVATTEFGEWPGPYEYILTMLEQTGNDESLQELDAYLQQSPAQQIAEEGERLWRAGEFRLFISHTAAHKQRAGTLADILQRVGIHAFVAHDTIEPTREWQDTIETALLTCDALCALLTTDFIASKWCDQEVGFVAAQRKLVLPLSMDADPHGFIGKYQAISSSVGPSGIYDDAEAMLSALIKHQTTTTKVAPVIARRYARSGSFDAARQGFALLEEIRPQDWTRDMVEEVERAGEENSQLKHGVLTTTGEPIPVAVTALLSGIRPALVPPAPTEDDLPF